MVTVEEVKERIRQLARKNPIAFAEWVSGFKLMPYQRKFMKDTSKRIVFVSGRQVGKSTVVALKAIWRAWCYPDQTILVIAPTLRQSEIVFKKIKNFILREDFIASDLKRLTMHNIDFKNGSSIHCLPAVQENIRGYTADMVIIDEAAYVSEDVFAAVEPALAFKDGTLILLSTPYTPEGYFYKAWTSPGWSKYHVPTSKNPYITKDWIEKYKISHTEIEFRREILGEFVEDTEESLFGLSTVRNAMKLSKVNRPQLGYRYFMGVDLARFGRDMTAVVVIGVKEGVEDPVFEMHGLYYRQKRPLNDTLGWILTKYEQWKPEKIFVDATGLGAGVFDMLVEKLGSIVEDVKVQGNQRIEMYMTVKRLLEEGKLLLIDDMKVLEHFMNYEVRYRSDGKIRIIKKPDGHDDISDATVYAVYGAVYELGYGQRIYVPKFDLDELTDKIILAESKAHGSMLWTNYWGGW